MGDQPGDQADPIGTRRSDMASKGGLLSDMQLKQWIKAGKQLSASDGNGLIFTLSAAGNPSQIPGTYFVFARR